MYIAESFPDHRTGGHIAIDGNAYYPPAVELTGIHCANREFRSRIVHFISFFACASYFIDTGYPFRVIKGKTSPAHLGKAGSHSLFLEKISCGSLDVIASQQFRERYAVNHVLRTFSKRLDIIYTFQYRFDLLSGIPVMEFSIYFFIQAVKVN